MLYKVSTSLLLVALSIHTVLGWGPIGHAAIATVAWGLMSKEAQKIAQTYIPYDTFADIASDADEYAETTEGAWSKPLHYVNMGSGETSFSFANDCPTPGCVVSAIMNYTSQLQKNETHWLNAFLEDRPFNVEEPNALEFVVHFVGDVHQPLHVGYLADKGGNEIPCTFFGSSGFSLHAIWDTNMIARESSSYSTWAYNIAADIKKNSSLVPYYTESMNPVDWADESFSYVRGGDVYNYNPESQRSESASCVIEDHYYDHNLPIVTERLTAASIRLATVLDKIFTSLGERQS